MLGGPVLDEGEPRRAPLPRQTLTAATGEAIRQRILAGDFREGESLRQDALADELGVSRVPVREALRQLEAEGLVTLLPHRGAVVTVLSLEEITELFDLRALIEPDLIRRAVPQMTDADLDTAEQILGQYDKSLTEGDAQNWGALNSHFHLALYKPSGRVRSMALLQTLLANVDRYIRLQLVLTSGIERARVEHAGMLDLCRRKDAKGAATLLRRHILHAGEDLVAFLARRRDEGRG
jgi:DNA-binding GntR family transcriptional regulator